MDLLLPEKVAYGKRHIILIDGGFSLSFGRSAIDHAREGVELEEELVVFHGKVQVDTEIARF